jgi:hypothetical protein
VIVTVHHRAHIIVSVTMMSFYTVVMLFILKQQKSVFQTCLKIETSDCHGKIEIFNERIGWKVKDANTAARSKFQRQNQFQINRNWILKFLLIKYHGATNRVHMELIRNVFPMEFYHDLNNGPYDGGY